MEKKIICYFVQEIHEEHYTRKISYMCTLHPPLNPDQNSKENAKVCPGSCHNFCLLLWLPLYDNIFMWKIHQQQQNINYEEYERKCKTFVWISQPRHVFLIGDLSLFWRKLQSYFCIHIRGDGKSAKEKNAQFEYCRHHSPACRGAVVVAVNKPDERKNNMVYTKMLWFVSIQVCTFYSFKRVT